MCHCEQTLFHQLLDTLSFSHDINFSYISVCFCLLFFHGRKWFIAHSQSESVDKRVDNEHRLSITSLFTPSLQQEKSILNREIENIKDLTTNFLSSLFFFFPMRKIFCTRLDWTPWVFLPAQDLLNKHGLKWSVFPFPTSCNRRKGRISLSYKWSHLPLSKPQNKHKHRKWENRNPHQVA